MQASTFSSLTSLETSEGKKVSVMKTVAINQLLYVSKIYGQPDFNHGIIRISVMTFNAS